VFEEILGIPAHPLLVHAAVVFIPLQVAAALAYALLPFARRYIAWFVIGMAVVAPLAALFAKLSGDAFRERLVRNNNVGGEILVQIDEHSGFGAYALYASLALGVLMLVLVWVQSRRSRPRDTDDNAEPAGGGSMVLAVIVTIVTVVAAGAAGYYVFKTGDSGAHIVWSGL
jgi:hypothetical protein